MHPLNEQSDADDDLDQNNPHENDGDNENSHPPVLESPRKSQNSNFLDIINPS